ncbi:MAG: sensor histidine kinase [Ruminococcus sp.]|nr:sensor histidine kinase [Ruminococcus sp.]
MQHKKRVRILLQFFWEQRMVGLFLVLAISIFALVFSMYDIKLEAILYASMLCLTAGLLFEGVHLISYLRRHTEQQKRLQGLPISYTELLPPRTLAEQDLQAMVQKLGEQYTAVTTDWQRQQKESLDYYSAWVHQIKTPISSMKMILQQEDTEENYLLSAELFRIEQYTEMALQYLRLDSKTNDFVFQQYDLDSIIRQAIRKYAPQFILRKIRLIYEPVSMTILTDEKWMLFLLEQLLSNAIKYTPHGSVTISVTPEKVLQVADTGIGIAPEDLPRIFEKGFTGYNGRADKKSTGLGLYLCQQAAKKISVSLSVTSEVGKGSVFSVHLDIPPLQVE